MMPLIGPPAASLSAAAWLAPLLLWQKSVPEHALVDLQHLLAVTGHQAVDVAVLEGGKSVRIL